MNYTTVVKNNKREIVKIYKGDLFSYAHIENNELTMTTTNFQEQEKILIPTVEELKTLFPNININTEIQKSFDNYKCKLNIEKCNMIQ